MTITGAAVSVTTIHVRQGDLEVSLVHTDTGTPELDLTTVLSAELGRHEEDVLSLVLHARVPLAEVSQ